VIRVTLDAGDTWSPARTLAGEALTGLGFVGADCFAGTLQGLLSSTDGGGTWTPIPLPKIEIPRLLASDGRALLIAADSRIWELGGDGNFSDLTTGMVPLQVQALWRIEGERFALARDGGLYRWDVSGQPSGSASGPGWRRMQGIDGIPFAITGSGKSLVLATSTGTYASLDGGGAWYPSQANGLRGEQIRALAFDGGFVYGGDSHGGLWRMGPAFPEPTVSLLPARRKVSSTRVRGILSALREAGRRLDGRSFP
jgi:hypothetical protein